ncbi:MAG: hypothetical protein OEM82_01865 [Acidobacteriota bacterium]|nr:hypothetical protein [Acidobacteriota bacterium]MDH3529669.1 hypothetical protein [Acidobacteriota bacterium]
MSLDPIFNDPQLKWIAKEWEENAERLATWGLKHLVNRFDVWGQYTLKSDSLGKSVSAVTLPIASLRGKGDMVTHDKLTRHFKGKKPNDLIGLHVTSAEATCRWFAVDLDVHEEQDSSYLADLNFRAMVDWHRKLRAQDLDPVILDSNGMGSFHLLVVLNEPHPLEDVFEYLENLTSNYEELELTKKPELFPSSAKLHKLGKWLRLPGRHHTHKHYSKVWVEEYGEGNWLEGVDAIDHLMSLRLMPLPGVTEKPESFLKKKSSVERRNRTVAVDLDGVLAEYDGWKGLENIGDPIEGAKEFMEALSEKYFVLVHTARIANENVKTEDHVQRVKNLVVEWLRENEIPYGDVYTGRGKPLASAFIDDRAVSCRPQEEEDSFAAALRALANL